MKKLIIFLAVFLFALDTNNIKEFFKNKEYKKVYEILSKEYLNYLDSLEMQFIYAKSAFYTKHFKDAIAALERILIYMPSNIYARYELAKVYYAIGDYLEAKSLFEGLLKDNIPAKMRNSIINYLKDIKYHLSRKKFFVASILTGVGYTYNLNFASNKDDFYVPVFNSYFKNILDEEQDFYHTENIFLDFIYKMETFYLQNRLNLYTKIYFNEKEYNLVSVEYSPVLSFIKDKYKIHNKFGFGNVFYGNQNYGYYFYYSPQLVYIPFNFLKTEFSLKFQRNIFKDNQHYYFLRLFSGINIKVWFFEVYPKFYVELDRKTTKEAIDIDKNIYFAGNDFILFSKYVLSFSYKYSTYLQKDPLFQENRKDHFYSVNLKKESNLFWGLKIITSLDFNKNYSNFAPYSYRQFQIQVSLKKDFR